MEFTRNFFSLEQALSKFSKRNFTPIQVIVLYYSMATIIAFLLFLVPFFRNPAFKIKLFDLFFLAISTISVTGLSTVDLSSVFNRNGIILLEILFQIGGFGIMMISTIFFLMAKKKISFRQRQLIALDINQPTLSGVVRLIKRVLLILFGSQIIFGFLFSLYFCWKNFYHQIGENFFWGFYYAISAITNSGFDLTGNSLAKFRNNLPFLYLMMFLMAIGSIGFPVLLEITEWWQRRKDRKKFRFSLFTKITVTTFIFLLIVGGIIIFLLEMNHFYLRSTTKSWLTESLFYSMSTRNSGLQLNHLRYFQNSTLLVFSFLMFIGASPSSVGGGVRTTTFAIVFLHTFAFIKKKKAVNAFHKRIGIDDLRKSIVIFNLSLSLCFASLLILMATQQKMPLIDLIVEIASAFGTTGLSLGITSSLNLIGKITIAILMFIGRVGPLYMLTSFIPKNNQDLDYKYPTEKIIIG